jgi:putative phage-type endonuclease
MEPAGTLAEPQLKDDSTEPAGELEEPQLKDDSTEPPGELAEPAGAQLQGTSVQETAVQGPEVQAEPYAEFAVSAQEAATIAGYEQRTERWRRARKWRLTGSNFAAAAGHNPYMSRAALVREMLWGTFRGNAATEWGQAHEGGARDMYVWAMRKVHPELTVRETGLCVSPAVPFLAVSPDGVGRVWNRATTTWDEYLLEIKCPFRWRRDAFYDDTVPTYYWDQLQGSMALLGLRYAHFVVWTPVAMQVTVVHFDAAYWEGVLLPALLDYYTTMFYPTLRAWRNNELQPPDIIGEQPLVVDLATALAA